jgi:mannitol-specific phosphotransferase system IIBC component
MATVRIDPKNKIFLTIFAIIIIGTIGFFIASIFIKNDDDDQNDTILKIKFQKRSKFSISLKEEEGKASKSDDNNGTRYVIEVYNGTLKANDKIFQ